MGDLLGSAGAADKIKARIFGGSSKAQQMGDKLFQGVQALGKFGLRFEQLAGDRNSAARQKGLLVCRCLSLSES